MHLDRPFGDVAYELASLGRVLELETLRLHVREVDRAIDELVPGASVRPAFVAALALAQFLDGAFADDDRIDRALEATRVALAGILDLLERHVAPSDRVLRRIVIRGETVEAALEAEPQAE